MRLKLGKFAQLLSKHKGKALLGAGLIPVAYLTWKKRDAITNGVKDLKGRLTAPKGEGAETVAELRLSDSRKTDLVNTVRFMLSKYDTEPFHIIYGRNKKQGFMGYSVRTARASIFFGWSDAFEERYDTTPFWIALDAEATRVFRERDLHIHYDVYANPRDEASVIISVPLEMMDNPEAVAGNIIELARKTLQ